MTQLLSKRPDQFSLGIWPGYFSRAKEVYVWDLDDNQYLDMSISGIGANILGYADSDVDDAVKGVIEKGNSCSLNCPEELELAELLCNLHPWAEMVRYTRSGGEAMAVAIRIARAYSGRDKIAFCGYHGWHDWYLSANLSTNNALKDHLLPGLSPEGVPKSLNGTAFPFRYNRIEELERIVRNEKGQLAAIVMEPIRNLHPVDGFIESVRNIADECGAVLVMDEISAAFRHNTGGAHLIFHQTVPDIAVFSKAMGNGYAIAAIIGKADVMQAAQKTFISSTNWTERIGPTAAIATIKKHQQHDVGNHLIEIGEQVRKGWKVASKKHGVPISIGGMKPTSHFIFHDPMKMEKKALFVQLMLERGILASNLFYAMYAHQEAHVERYLNAVDLVFEAISTLDEQEKIHESLIGEPAVAGFKRLN